MKKPKAILITGASSGLGAELAKIYAATDVTLFLCGRNDKRLKEVQDACKELGAKVFINSFDITDAAKTREFINTSYKESPIDLVIANAGISAGTGGFGAMEETERVIFDTNLNGVLNTILPIIPLMQQRKTGQIAIISSLAAYRGLPSAPAYSASKASVKAYGEALRGSLALDGIKVNVVTPGYIKTPLTDKNKFPMPFLMEAKKAAKLIKFGLRLNLPRIAFPFTLYFITWFLSILSPLVTDYLFAKLPKK